MDFQRHWLFLRAMNCEGASTDGDRVAFPVFTRFAASISLVAFNAFLFLLAATVPLAARTKDKISYGEGLIVNIPLPESEVEQVVADVAQNGVIRGTKEYNKDQFIMGAKAADTSPVFTPWEQAGKVFYKVREQAIDPRNFKDTNDVGTLAVRYVVQPQGTKNTVLRIDALFEEEFRHVLHQSDGSVENAEYKDIREHLDTIEVMKAQTVEAQKEREEQLARKQNPGMQDVGESTSSQQSEAQTVSAPMESSSITASQGAAAVSSEPPVSAQAAPGQTLPGQTLPGQTLEEHIKDLRKQVERLVKSPGAPLKSAPFHTASTLVLLNTGAEVLVLISTPYWYGVETHDGQHGWMERDQLELLP
jgi:DNA-binding protein H-NS